MQIFPLLVMLTACSTAQSLKTMLQTVDKLSLHELKDLTKNIKTLNASRYQPMNGTNVQNKSIRVNKPNRFKLAMRSARLNKMNEKKFSELKTFFSS